MLICIYSVSHSRNCLITVNRSKKNETSEPIEMRVFGIEFNIILIEQWRRYF